MDDCGMEECMRKLPSPPFVNGRFVCPKCKGPYFGTRLNSKLEIIRYDCHCLEDGSGASWDWDRQGMPPPERRKLKQCGWSCKVEEENAWTRI